MTVAEVFQEISAADFFYRNRDIAGFTSPSRSIYSTIRELIENSLDACETGGIPPDIYVRLSHESGPLDDPVVFYSQNVGSGTVERSRNLHSENRRQRDRGPRRCHTLGLWPGSLRVQVQAPPDSRDVRARGKNGVIVWPDNDPRRSSDHL